MPFNLINVESGEAVCSLLTEQPLAFETAEQANEVARVMSRDTGAKYKLKRLVDDQWKAREAQKFADGTYEYLPWVHDTWWRHPDARGIHSEHFPHPSLQEPGKIAFTESPEKGADDIRTQIKPGRYLERYFSGVLRAYGIDVKELAHEFAHYYEPRTLRFATTEDEIQRVYEDGPPSCMSNSKYRKEHGWGYPEPGEWPGEQHACRVYAAGDLQVAYILDTDSDPDSTIIARALVWPQKMTHSRIYGDEARLKRMLMSSGYRFDPPIGAKLKRVRHGSKFLLPYIDGGQRSGQGSLAVLDMGDHLKIVENHTPKAYAANNTSGLSGNRFNVHGDEVDSFFCDHCEAESEGNIWRVYVDNGEERQTWCQDCAENDAFCCGNDGHYYEGATTPHVRMANGDFWTQDAFNGAGFTCQGNGLRYPRSRRLQMSTGELWSTQHFQQHGFRSTWTNYPHRLDLLFSTPGLESGTRITEAEFLANGFTCRSCARAFNNYHRTRRSEGGAICLACDDREQRQLREQQSGEQLARDILTYSNVGVTLERTGQ